MKPSETANKAYNRKKWSILFIGEDGKVVTVKHFKGMVSVLAVVLMALIVAVAILYYQYRYRAERTEALREDMAHVITENRRLKDEKDQMLARLVILESQLNVREERQLPQETGRAQDRGAASKTAVNEPAPQPKTEPEKPQESADSAAAGSAQATSPPIRVANENLIVCQDPETEFMRVEYKVINIGAKDVPVAGRSIIILKGGNMNSEDWIVLPNVPLSDLKPAGEKGKRFRIYNFRTLKYKVQSSAVKGRLETATIFTYTEDGKLIMERDYPVEKAAEMCP